MKVRDFLDKLLFKLGEGDLQYVATELKSYFKTIHQDNFWIKQSEEILDSLKDVKVNKDYTEETRKLKIQEVKDELRKIISTIKEKTNVESQYKSTISNVPKEEFEGLVNLQEGTISVKSKGGEGTINRTGKILIRSLIVLAILFGLGYYFSSRDKPEEEKITNCDCSKIDELRNNTAIMIAQKEAVVDSLKNEITILESKGLNEARIQEKEKLLETKRNLSSRIDSIEGLILPEIESIASKCPFQDCDNSISEILNKLNK